MPMNKCRPLKALVQATVAALAIIGLLPALHSAEPNAGTSAPTNSVELKASSAAAAKTSARPQLTGAELYSIHCNRCHPERYPTERTAAQWKTIMLHMQVRVSIPGKQAKLILNYLQENSGR